MSIKLIKGSLFNETSDYKHQSWFEVLPPHIEYNDLFDPKLWANFTAKFNQHDLVRVRADDGSFDVQLTVRKMDVGGIHMELWPVFGKMTGEAAVKASAKASKEAAIKCVPLASDGRPVVRVEHKPATKWRVLGLNGEVKRDIKTKAEALQEMDAYLALARLEMPPEADAA